MVNEWKKKGKRMVKERMVKERMVNGFIETLNNQVFIQHQALKR